MSDTYTIDTPFNGGTTTDAVPIDPFAGFILTNPDTAAIGTATIVLSAAANGTLSNLTTGTLSPDGSTYTVTGSTAAIQAALRALVFTPTDHQVAPGQTVTTVLALTVSDTASTVTDNADNLVLATAVANVPALHVTHPPDPITDAQTATPFSPVAFAPLLGGELTVTDPDVGATEATTITLTAAGTTTATDANGTLSGAGLIQTGIGTYQLAAGSPASVQAALDALVFTPTPLGVQSSVTTDIGLQVANSVGGTTNIVIGQTVSDTGAGLTYVQGSPVPGNPGIFGSHSITTETSTIGAPATQTSTADETTIAAVLNGTQIVYQQSFGLPFADPTVQAAVAQANLVLAQDGAAPGTPALTSSATTSESSTIVASAPSVVTSISITENFGPGTLGPFDVGGVGGTTPNAYVALLPGQEDSNVNVDTQTTTDLTASTTITTTLLTQQYTLSGSSDAYVIAGTQAAQATTDAAAIDPFAGVTVNNADTSASGTATVVLSGAANGTLSNLGTGALSPDGTTYTVSGATGVIQAALQALVFTPADHQTTPGGTETTGFDLTVSDGVSTVTDSTTSVVATAAEDAPVIGGTPTVYRTGLQEVAAGQTPVPFAAVTLTDPDFGALETSTITLDAGDANGTLSGTDLTKTGVGTYLLATLSPAAEQAALRLLVFNTPLDSGSVTGFTLQVSDGIAPPVTDTNTIVQMLPPDVTTVPGEPSFFISTSSSSTASYVTTPVTNTAQASATTIEAVLDGTQVVYDQTFALPYSDPTVQAAVVQADAILTADGAVGGTPSLTSSATTNQGSQTTTVQTGEQTGTPTDTVTTNFGPGTIYVGPSASVPFTLLAGQEDTNVNTDTQTTIDQTATTTTTELTTQAYTISGSNDAYVIAGTQAAEATTDAAAIDPFSAVTVSNADTAASGTATVVLSAAANGTLSNLGTGTLSPDGTTYTVSGATGVIQVALQALVFTPADHQTTPGGTETTGFDLTVSDGVSTVTDSTTSVVATAAEDAPVIGGTTHTEIIEEAGGPTVYRTGLQEVAAGQTPVPFAAVTLTDPDFGALETSTITLDAGDANGTLSGTDLTKTGVGTYLLATLSPAAEQAALRLLVFNTPLDSSSVTGFTLQVSDGIAPPVIDTNTIVQMMPPDVTAVQGVPNTFNSTSTTSTTSTNTTPATQTDTTNATTITAVLDGSQVVYDQTFALPYSDPTVQAAIVQANAALTADGAVGGTPSLTSSATTNQGSQTTTVQTGQQTGTPTFTFTTNFGPGTIYVGPSASLPFTLLAGQVDFNTNTDTPVTIDQTATTTTTELTTQAYAISGSNDAYVIGGTLAGQATTDAAAIDPFAGVTVNNADTAASGTATVVLSAAANGTLSNLGTGALSPDGSTYTVSGTAAVMQAALRALVFTPTDHQTTPGGTETTGFGLTVSDGVSTVTDNATSVIATALGGGASSYVTPVPGAPGQFTSTSATSTTSTNTTPVMQTDTTNATTITAVLDGTQVVYDQTFALPYSDPTVQAAVVQADAILTADGAVGGTPALTSSATTNQGSQTTTVQTGEQTGTPTVTLANNFGPGTIYVGPSASLPYTLLAGQEDLNVNTDTLTTIDQTATTTTTELTTQAYAISGSNDAYVIGGTLAGQAATDAAAIDPFAGVTVNNADTAASGTATVTLSATANGMLSNLGTGTLSPDGSTYTVSGTAAVMQAALRALVFTPTDHQTTPGGTETTGFGLTVSDGVSTATNDATGVTVTTGTAIGDVHLVTFDGLHYDFQADGDFTLARSTVAGNSFDIQIVTTPWLQNDLTSLTTQVAAQVGTSVVGFALGGGVTINGIADTALDAAHPQQLLGGGTLTALGSGDYQLAWAGGEALTVTDMGIYLNLHTVLPASDGPGSVQGLLGTLNGQANDIALPDGTVLAQPVLDAVLLGQFADAWRVGPGQSILGGVSTPIGPETLGLPTTMTLLAADAPGEVLTGSLSAGGPTGAGVTIEGSLANLAGAVIANFSALDAIDVTGVDIVGAAIRYAASANGGQLTITDGLHAASMTVLGPAATATIQYASDQHGGTLLWIG